MAKGWLKNFTRQVTSLQHSLTTPQYLWDPPGAPRGQQLAGGAQAVLVEAGGGRGDAQLSQQQHVIVAVPLGQPRQAVALPL